MREDEEEREAERVMKSKKEELSDAVGVSLVVRAPCRAC